MSKPKKDRYGKTAQTASQDVCAKCNYFNNDIDSETCKHCVDNLKYNEYYKKE